MSNTKQIVPLLGIPVLGPAMHRVWLDDKTTDGEKFLAGPRGEYAVRTGLGDDEGALWLVRSNGWHSDLMPFNQYETGGMPRRAGGIPLKPTGTAAPTFVHRLLGEVDDMESFCPEQLRKAKDFSGVEFEDLGHIARWHCQGTLRDDLHCKLWLDVETGSPIINGTLLFSAARYRDREGARAPAGVIGSFTGPVHLTFGDEVVVAMPKHQLTRVGNWRTWSAVGSEVWGDLRLDFGAWIVIQFVLAPNPGIENLDDEDMLWLRNASLWGNKLYGIGHTPEVWLGERPVSNEVAVVEARRALEAYKKALADGADLLTDNRPFTPYNAGGQAGSQPHLGATFAAHLWFEDSREILGDRVDPTMVELLHWTAIEKLLRPEKSWEPGSPGRLWRADQHPLLRYDDGQPHRRGSDTLQFPGAQSEALPRFSCFGNYAATPDTHREEEVVVAAAKLTGCPALRLYLEHWVEGFLASGRLKDGWAQIPRASGRRCRSYLNAIGVVGGNAGAGAEDLVATWMRGDLYSEREELWTPAVDAWTDQDARWWSPYEHAQMLHAACRLVNQLFLDPELQDFIERTAEALAVSLVRATNSEGDVWILPYHCQVIVKPAPIGDEPVDPPTVLTPSSPEVKLGGSNWLAWGGCGIVGVLGLLEKGFELAIHPQLVERLQAAREFLRVEGTGSGVDCNYALVEVV